jgi:two-component system nitrogen regulation response regulator GlnG
VVVLDIRLPDGNGLDVFRRMKEVAPRRPVVFITAHGNADTAIEAMKEGAFDYLIKPVDLDRLTLILGRAFDAARLMNTPAVVPALEPGDRIVGHGPAVQEMSKSIGRLAPQDVNVLILGESGAGKELVARALYQHGRRADRPFLAVNCAALPEALFESELFGHEQGAFTGATRRRIGLFEQAHDGTLFLDEIGDISPTGQAKLLRVLQEQQFQRVGGDQTLISRARVLAATNKDLQAEVAAGRFRADLFYRLKVVTIHVPALRDRREDIPDLVNHFLLRFNRELGLNVTAVSPEAMERLRGHPWPGNVRELMSALKQAMLSASGPVLTPESLPPEVREASPLPAEGGELQSLVVRALRESPGKAYVVAIEEVERLLLSRALEQTGGHQAKASDLLGINRTTLRAKLRQLGLSVGRVVTEIDGGETPAPPSEGEGT